MHIRWNFFTYNEIFYIYNEEHFYVDIFSPFRSSNYTDSVEFCGNRGSFYILLKILSILVTNLDNVLKIIDYLRMILTNAL